MFETILLIAKVLLGLSAGLCLIRLIKGPHVLDRLLAQDTLSIHIVAIILLIGMELQSRFYINAALLIALFSFISTIVAAKYIKRGHIID